MRCGAGSVLALCFLQLCSAATDVRNIQPFTELDLCLPFNVRIENSANASAYSVLIDADESIIKAIQTTWSSGSQYFTPFAFTQPGALELAASGNIQTANPVQITVRVPNNTLQVIDVTTGTEVSFAPGFNWTTGAGLWNVPSGATVLAPEMAIDGPMCITLSDSPLDPPFQRGGRVVWTNARADQEVLQAVSLGASIQLLINATGNATFTLQPRPDLPAVNVSYANITLAVDLGENVTATSQPGAITYYPAKRTCYGADCAIRLLTGSYPSPAVERIGHTNMANRMGDYIPARVATPVPWTTCTSGITDFQCDADTTNQTCVAGLAASI